MAFDISTIKPLIAAAETAGLPIVENLLTLAITPYTGPFAPLIVGAADTAIRAMNDHLGLPLDAPPDATAAKIMDDPADAATKLQAVEAANQHVLDMAKLGIDADKDAQALQGSLYQAELSSTTAGTWARVFQAGWRPFVAWGLALSLGGMLIMPDVAWAVTVLTGRVLPPFPNENFGTIMATLGALLGLGTLRTVEKFGGVAAAPALPQARPLTSGRLSRLK